MWHYFAFTNFGLFLYVVAWPLDIRKIFVALSTWCFLTHLMFFGCSANFVLSLVSTLVTSSLSLWFSADNLPLLWRLTGYSSLYTVFCLGNVGVEMLLDNAFLFVVNVLLLFLAELYFIFHILKQRWLLSITSWTQFNCGHLFLYTPFLFRFSLLS